MVERLKRWESPRKRGRNDKGKGGSARARQLRKREQMLRQKLKNNAQKSEKTTRHERDITPSFFLSNCSNVSSKIDKITKNNTYEILI